MTNRDNLRADFVDDGLVKFSDGTLAMWCDFHAAWRPIDPEHVDVLGYEHKHTTEWGGRAAEYLRAIDVEVDSGIWAATMIDTDEGFGFVLFTRHAIAHDVTEATNRFVGEHDVGLDVAETMASEDELRIVYGFAGPFATRDDTETAWQDAPGQTTECLAWRTRFGWFYATA